MSEQFRSTLPEVFCKKGVLRISCEFFEISKYTFSYRTSLVATSDNPASNLCLYQYHLKSVWNWHWKDTFDLYNTPHRKIRMGMTLAMCFMLFAPPLLHQHPWLYWSLLKVIKDLVLHELAEL